MPEKTWMLSMAKFTYAKGRISETLQFISREMKEFEEEYMNKTWKEYQKDTSLQKLIDRTVENILTALIELCGTILVEKGISVESYGDVLKKVASLFGLEEKEQESLLRLAVARNRLAHRYLNFRWNAVELYKDNKELVKKLLNSILKTEEERTA